MLTSLYGWTKKKIKKKDQRINEQVQALVFIQLNYYIPPINTTDGPAHRFRVPMECYSPWNTLELDNLKIKKKIEPVFYLC